MFDELKLLNFFYCIIKIFTLCVNYKFENHLKNWKSKEKILKLLPLFCIDPIQASSMIPGAGFVYSPTTPLINAEVILCKL